MKIIILLVVAYYIIAFIFKVLINVFSKWLPKDIVDNAWEFTLLWIVIVPIALIYFGLGKFADWLAKKIKDKLGWK